MKLRTHLNSFKVNNFWKGIAEHGISSIFSRMTHGIKSSVTAPCSFFQFPYFIEEVLLVSFPVSKSYRKQKLSLATEKCPPWLGTKTHVSKDKQNLLNSCSCYQNPVTLQHITKRISPKDQGLQSPNKCMFTTFLAMLTHFDHCSILPHGYFWIIILAFKTEHIKKLEKHAIKHHKWWLSIGRRIHRNSKNSRKNVWVFLILGFEIRSLYVI